ncbi:MAG: helix-turn-helix domain-containing protein [Haloarculaceae archaeon]
MDDVSADLRVQHPDLVLTDALRHDGTATVRPASESAAESESGTYVYTVTSSDFERFEAGLRDDPTIADFERVIHTAEEDSAIYSLQYTNEAILFSPAVSASNGVVLEMENDGTSWLMTVWLPDRQELSDTWEYAEQNDIDLELQRITDYTDVVAPGDGLTDSQQEALLVAYEAGYFEEPRDASLDDVADELGISQPAAGGLLRRGVRRLVQTTLADDTGT